MARVAAALLATKIARGRLASPVTAREVYRNEWTGLTEPRVVQGALDCFEDLGWIRAAAVRARDGGRPTVRFRINPGVLSGLSVTRLPHDWTRSRRLVFNAARKAWSPPGANSRSGLGRPDPSGTFPPMHEFIRYEGSSRPGLPR